MVKEKELEIHTVIVDGSISSFRAALSRSILGVTWVKFKKKRQAFYRHRVHNLAITQSVFNWLYELLLTNLRNLKRFQLKTDLKPKWSGDGKIQSISDVTVSVYIKIGELKVKELQVFEEFKSVKIDLFYSKTGFLDRKLRSELPHLIESMGIENFDYHEYDFSLDEGKTLARAYDVKGTPTVVINAEKKLENPDEKKLRQEIERAFAPVVKPVDKPEFIFDREAKPNVESLVTTLKIKTPS